MVDVTVRKQIDPLALTAEDWDLFVGDKKTEQRVNRAAFRMNEKFTECVNAGMDRSTVEAAVYDVMVQFSDTGASDTEPQAVLYGLLDKVFGEQ